MTGATKPRLAITMGDPAGVGPEVCCRALSEPSVMEVCRPVVFGDATILADCARTVGVAWSPELQTLDTSNAPSDGVTVIDFPLLDRASFRPGRLDANTGAASIAYIEAAIQAALDRKIAGVVTGPISKEAIHSAGVPFPGHTELFAARTGASQWCMMQYSEIVTCSFVTVHVGYAEVPALLTTESIVDVIELTAHALRRIRGREPRLVVCGLNPHAGEHGLFGQREEERVIEPACEVARSRGRLIVGPVPPDTAFTPQRRAVTDGVVCMYHDQGHIPVKALAFDSAVNTTLGLPIVRTSVDHGTAADIAWQGVADCGSLIAAIRLAAKLSQLD